MKHFAVCLSFALALLAPLATLRAAAPVPLVNHGDLWHFHKGTNAPQTNWQTLATNLLNAEWAVAPGGFGYGDAGIVGEATTLSDMNGGYRSVSIRRVFTVASTPLSNDFVQLTIDYDDGFAVWLDGVLLASNNVNANLDWNTSVPADHEASCCGTGANSPETFLLGSAAALLPPGEHTLAIMGWNQSRTSSDFHLIPDLAITDGTPPPTSNIVWYATNSPVVLASSFTVPNNTTLLIEPGVVVQLGTGVNLNISGTLLAEGVPTNRIRFTRSGGSAWGEIALSGANRQHRITFADVDGSGGNIAANGTAVHLESLVFTNTSSQMVDLTSSSVVLLDSFFPPGNGVEIVHFSTMPAGGHALIQSNVFSSTTGYSDIIDFTGGNRPGPVVQFIGNLFLGGVDDGFDMDGTDAHIEGNVFVNVKQDAARASSSNGITTGEDTTGGSAVSELFIARNWFHNCDHAFLLKNSGRIVARHNTFHNISANPNDPQPSAVISWGEPNRGVTGGGNCLFEGNIAWLVDADRFVVNHTNALMPFLVRHNILPTNWPGTGNIVADPLFVAPSNITGLNITANLALQPGSPARGAGLLGLDLGATAPGGAHVAGAPAIVSAQSNLTLQVGGPAIVAYKWRLNGSAWSQEIHLTNDIAFHTNLFGGTNGTLLLAGLTNGQYHLEVIGKNSANVWQGTNYGSRVGATNIPSSYAWAVSLGAPDADGDGVSDADEALAGTDPQDRNSYFRIETRPGGGGAGGAREINFAAVSNRTYTIQYRDSLATGPWLNWTNLPAVETNRVIQLPVEQEPGRYFRLATPALP